MDEYEPDPLDEHEEVRGVFNGGRGQVGHQFVVTNRRLVMAPTTTLGSVAGDVATKAGSFLTSQPGAPGAELVREILRSYAPFGPPTVWLWHVVEVRAGNNGGILKAPQLVFTTDTRHVESLGVVKEGWSPSPSPANVAARNEMVEVLTRAVADASSAPHPG